ncbi:ergothioneine biosynthesis PLP-dependent enzyme EgtE [Mycolicibacterium komossense]|uniref:Probable hercynylcysteine sulfoxide lyase n=1 Tax=Mycolicibacterium komossense TaxID=1779 RepID=A0ABT3C9H3_9MYCO|nr:ergothioneine biosynthesis PLP-dependent enzyme EgtE [Mycolicibacterium komossense]MCV7225901.1 ergothioneine biosynthesis PLP-dependent enzyme EgtE [Mycolicibacterium komossense]
MTTLAEDDLARDWRSARPVAAGVHVDSAACSRQSFATIDAAAQHARHEAEVGGYVAAAAAQSVLDAGRAGIGALIGMGADDVAFTTGSNHALDLLLGSWPGPRTVACALGEYGPNLALMAAHGFTVSPLAVDEHGRVRADAVAAALHADSPALVHLTGIGSHRGVAQPLAEVADACRTAGVPLVLDAAQALGQLDCAIGADAVYSSSRKWMAGPRGVGFLAVRPGLAQRLRRRVPPPEWELPISAMQSFEQHEANLAARVGFSVAVGQHLAAGPAAVRARLASIGRATRTLLDGVGGWRVVEPRDERTAITTLAPPAGVQPAVVRDWLITERGIVTTVAESARAPFELTGPVLRLSPHVDVTAADLQACAEALESAATTPIRT